jgi:hypothetical protein
MPDETNPPGLAFSTTDGVPYLAFDAGATNEEVYWTFRLPTDYASGPLLQIQWSNAASDTGNCRWGCQVHAITPNSDTDDATAARTFGTENTATDAGVATRRVQEVQMTLTNFDGADAEDLLVLKFYRDSSDAGDTMNTDDAYLWAVSFEYTTT